MRRRSLLLALLVLAPAFASETRWPLDKAPEPMRQEARRAITAFSELRTTLEGRLQQALAAGGAPAAISVCRLEAPKATATVGQSAHLEMGRTSTRLRNPQNAPRSWVRPYLARYANAPAKEAPVEVVDLGAGRMGVIAPIGLQPLCTTCHGDPNTMSPELLEALKTNYPHDQATGFSPGQLRGVFWAEIAK